MQYIIVQVLNYCLSLSTSRSSLSLSHLSLALCIHVPLPIQLAFMLPPLLTSIAVPIPAEILRLSYINKIKLLLLAWLSICSEESTPVASTGHH